MDNHTTIKIRKETLGMLKEVTNRSQSYDDVLAVLITSRKGVEVKANG